MDSAVLRLVKIGPANTWGCSELRLVKVGTISCDFADLRLATACPVS